MTAPRRSRRASDLWPLTPPPAEDPIAYNPGTLADPIAAVDRTMAAFRKEVRGRPLAAYEKGRQSLDRLREVAAQTFGGAPDNWAMADGHTATIDRLSNVIGQLLGGDVEVVTTRDEHVGGLGAFSADPRVKVHEVPVEKIAQTPGSLFFLSHISYSTNCDYAQHIQALTARRDSPIVIVDGSQAVGQVPVDVGALGAHAYVASGHKWLGGPHGTGLLYLRSDVIRVWPSPFRAGEPICRDRPIGKWEPRGGQDFSRIAGLVAAIEEFRDHSHQRAYQRDSFARGLRRVLGDRVFILPSAPQGRTVVFAIEGTDVYDVYRRLNQVGVSLKCIKRRDERGRQLEVLRAGFPWWTTSARIRQALSALAAAVQETSSEKVVAA